MNRSSSADSAKRRSSAGERSRDENEKDEIFENDDNDEVGDGGSVKGVKIGDAGGE